VRTWYSHSLTAAHGLLEMFGAFSLPGNAINRLGPGNYVAAPSLSGLAEAVAVTRLACVALAIAGAGLIARRFFRRDTGYFSLWQASPAALRRLGTLLSAASRATLDPGEGYTIHAYQGNLLAQLPLIRHC
jgi:hypothetical protein